MRPRMVLICHEDSLLDRWVLAAWFASFTDLVGVLVIRENSRKQLLIRARREMKRVGFLGLIDVFLFRLYYRLRWAKEDRRWEARLHESLSSKYPANLLDAVNILVVDSPNSPEAADFIRQQRPEFVMARCKFLLRREILAIPTHGVWVLHPGHCPEYRNAHGCFWALVMGEPELVSVTLLRADAGVDTGPVYGYFKCKVEANGESHIRLQERVLFENLDQISERLLAIYLGRAVPISTLGRPSNVWGQPRLIPYIRYRIRSAVRRKNDDVQ